MAMITHEIIVLDPTVGPLPIQATMAPRPSTLNGLTVGLLAVVLIGVYPAPLLDLIAAASQAILPGV